MNVVIYTRFSSHNQTDQSTQGQIKECRAYAERNGLNIIGTYTDEAKSGTRDDRANFQRMIKDSEKKQFQGVLVYQLDRFARNKYDSAIYKKKLEKNGVKVYSARENINNADASSVLMESVLEGMAEYFSLELGQKVQRGMAINAENCYYNGGTVPLGLKLKSVPVPLGVNHKIIYKKKFDIDPETAPIVKKIFEMYIGDNTMADIIRYLNERNVKTSFDREFNKNSIRTIILNKKYIGIYSYKGKETPNAIPRIIDDDTFYKAQDKLLKNKEAPARTKAKTNYLLTTKLFCGTCKEMM
ncbi:MAG: recombinase family protein [Candidatus Scatovivens sp.]